MKRACETSESGPSKRCQVSPSTLTKWQAQLECEYHNDVVTLCYIKPAVVDMLWCHACRTNDVKVINYSTVWIRGSTTHKTSCVTDHTKSDQHKAAMNYTRKAPGVSMTEYICNNIGALSDV